MDNEREAEGVPAVVQGTGGLSSINRGQVGFTGAEEAPEEQHGVVVGGGRGVDKGDHGS